MPNIYFIAGASGSGKSAVIPELKKCMTGISVYDFDDIGVPKDPDKMWRQQATEQWIQRLLQEKTDVCLLGQMVLGEIVACPSARNISRINFCLLDVVDRERIQRLKNRNTYGLDQNMLNWASWLRMHHHDPKWMMHVIRDDAWDGLNFDELLKIKTWDSRADIMCLDTTDLSLHKVAFRINQWIRRNDCLTRCMTKSDVKSISDAFLKIGWSKPRALFENYLKEQNSNERLVWLSFWRNQCAGYVTLKWHSEYRPFYQSDIPEIMDLNVLPAFRGKGIGSRLLVRAEQAALERKHHKVGLGVGLYAGNDGGYGFAQRLYVRRGYIPDGKGITYQYNAVTPGESYPIDDDLILWFTKKL